MSDRAEALTPAALAALEKVAVPCTGLALTPSGDVLVSGRHALGIADSVVRLSPEDALSMAHTIAMALLGSIRLMGASPRGDRS